MIKLVKRIKLYLGSVPVMAAFLAAFIMVSKATIAMAITNR